MRAGRNTCTECGDDSHVEVANCLRARGRETWCRCCFLSAARPRSIAGGTTPRPSRHGQVGLPHLVCSTHLSYVARPHRRHRARLLLALGSAGHRADLGPETSRISPHRIAAAVWAINDSGAVCSSRGTALDSGDQEISLNGRAQTSLRRSHVCWTSHEFVVLTCQRDCRGDSSPRSDRAGCSGEGLSPDNQRREHKKSMEVAA